jgi:Saxitoxin biosynthesis operon protein SxtJ
MAKTKFSAIEPELEPELLKSGSDRSLGIVFAAALTFLGAWPLTDGRSPRFWFLLAACAFALAATYAPWILRPLNAVWTRLGALLHRIVTPIAMGVVFFVVVTPIAWMMRALGKDPLRLKRDTDAKTYWIERQPPGPDPQTMTRQF